MPVFEVEHNGKTYEVDAPSAEAASKAFTAPDADQSALSAITQKAAQNVGFGREDYTPTELEDKAVGARATESGVVEGGKRLWGGLKQAAASAQDFYNMFVHGKSERSEDVVTLPSGERKRMHELLDSSKEKQVIADELMRQQVDTEKARDAGVSVPQREAAAGATQLGALTVAPELLPGKATTMTGAMVRNATLSSASNAAMFDAEGGGLGNAAVAAGAPAVFGTIPALAPAVKNYLGRAFSRAVESGRMLPRLAAAESALPTAAKTFTLAQRTGIPELITLERAANNSQLVEHFADQTDKFVADTVNALRRPLKDGQTLANDFVAAREKASSNLKSFRIAANDNFETGIKDARRIAAEGGGGNLIPVDTFRNEAENVFEQVRGLRERGVQKDIFTKRFMDHTESLFKGKGTVTANELSNLLVDLTALQKSESPVTRKFAGQLREKLDTDLDQLEGKASFHADDATKTILETRAEYKRAQHLIGELQDSAAHKLLGVEERDVPPDQVLEKFKTFSPEKRGSIRNFLEENNPAMLESLKNAAATDIQKAASSIRPGADSQADLGQMVDNMFDAKKGFDMRTSGLWNDAELKHIEGVKEGLRTIANSRPNVGPAGTPIKPEDIAINAVSQHPAFLARAAARVLMSFKGAKFFTDPRVYERLRVIDRTTTGSPTNLIARAALLDYMNTNYLEEEKTDGP
jgi:hypothetical protein